MNDKKMGDLIAKLRKEKNMTQRELAERLNVTDKAVSNMSAVGPALYFLQLFRGFLWALPALLILYSLDGKRFSSILIPGLLFSVLIAAPLLFPNHYMPAAVRLGHSFELTSSMLTYGIICALMLKEKSSELWDAASSPIKLSL